MSDKTIVVKLGGHAMTDADLLASFAGDVAALFQSGIRVVIVHGGGPHISALLRRLDIDSGFVNGLRVTDEATLEVVEMVLCGSVNKQIVRVMQQQGLAAVGVSGQDGNLLLAAERDLALGRVGRITSVQPRLLEVLLAGGFLPVVAPLALDAAGEALNVNADTAAGAIAGALNADFFVLVSDVPGVLDDQQCLVPCLNGAAITRMREAGIITGGMIPKVECCQASLQAGCKSAVILDGREKNNLARLVEKGEARGTLIIG